MTKIEGLDENLSPQPNDWIPIQPPGQKIKKVKLGNLPIQSDTSALEAEINNLQSALDLKADSSTLSDTAGELQNQINNKVDNSTLANTVSVLEDRISTIPKITSSQAPPNNPQLGDKWHQTSQSNIFLNEWIWDGRFWKSSVHSYHWSHSIGDVNWHWILVPLAPDWGYYLIDCNYIFNNKGVIEAEDYYFLKLGTLKGNTSPEFFFQKDFKNLEPQTHVRENFEINRYAHLDNSGIGFIINYAFEGNYENLPKTFLGININYQLVYK